MLSHIRDFSKLFYSPLTMDEGLPPSPVQALEVEDNTAGVEAAIRIERLGDRLIDDNAAIGQSALAQQRARHEVVPVRSDIEDVVGADRELEAFGDIVPQFQIRQADT